MEQAVLMEETLPLEKHVEKTKAKRINNSYLPGKVRNDPAIVHIEVVIVMRIFDNISYDVIEFIELEFSSRFPD